MLKLIPKEGETNIAMLRIGGIGDALTLAAQASAVKRKYPNSFITLFLRDGNAREAVDGHPAINRLVVIGNKRWEDALKYILEKPYDIVYDNRYVTKIYYPTGKIKINFEAENRAFKPYQAYYEQFPPSNNKIVNLGKTHYELMLETACLKGSEDDLYISLTKKDCSMAKLIEQNPVITVHNGADIARQTKCWQTKNWNILTERLFKRGYKVIQLGKGGEEPISGAIDMRGMTTLKETAGIIASAKMHIDTEGGLVHIARAVRTRSIVLFGPTPAKFFGYKENINIEAKVKCKGCWWKTDLWWRECPEGYQYPFKCMDEIIPDMVYEKVKVMEKFTPMQMPFNPADDNEQFAMGLTLNEAHYKSEPHQWDRIYTMMSLIKGKKVLEVGAGDGYCVEVLRKQGLEVTATEVSRIRIDRMKRSGIDAKYADVNKLPFPDNSFDTVICGEVLEHIDSIALGLKELERVCKPDGAIIISLPVADEYRLLKMHKWGIGHHAILKDEKINLIVLKLERINRDVSS